MATNISVTPGHIGQKTDKSNLLTYSITTDGAMTAVTEKVNGVVIGTKTATSGQSLIAGLTQAQWDAVRFGKYGNHVVDVAPKSASDWESGSVDVTSGALIANGTRIRTKVAKTLTNQTLKLTINPNYLAYVIEYTSGGGIAKTNSWMATGATVTLASATTSIRLLIKRVDEGAIAADEAVTANLSATYTDANFAKNTLTVEMGGEKWTYTFEKRVASDADILSAVKAVKDSQEVALPAVKAQLADKVGSSAAISFEDIISNIRLNKKEKEGTFTMNSSSVAVTGLGFFPRIICLKFGTSTYYYTNTEVNSNLTGVYNTTTTVKDLALLTRTSDGFSFTYSSASTTPYGIWNYYAWE